MILLNGHSQLPERKIPLEGLGLQLKERDSTATMIPADMTGIGVNSWMQDDTEPGRGIVWRVKSVGQAFTTRTPTVQLEHMINSLRDRIMFGEIKPAQITGNAKATTCTAEQAVRYILSYQSDWVLGAFDYWSVSNPYKFDGDSLFDALETVSNSLADSWWSYDMSVYPFRLNITRKSAEIGSEMRAGRNMKTITRTIDKSGMYTRFYPTGKDDLHIPGDYVERNVNLYGVVSKIETDASIDSAEELARWANERLNLHAEPTVTIDVEGIELANATGVSLDRMQLGKYCRVPLPEFGTEITERIVSLTYQDKIHQPEVVKITLANNRTDVTKIIADAIKSGGGGKGGRTSTKQDKEDHAWFEDTNNHVAMVAEGIIGRDAEGNPNWTRLSEIVVNEDGIYSQVKSVQGDIVVANTKITQNEYAITQEANIRISENTQLSSRITQTATAISSEVTARINADNQMGSRITQTANSITAEVNRATAAEGNLSSRITVNAEGIETKVSKNGVISSINQSAEAVTINASKINLTGYVTASDLASTNAAIDNLKTGVTAATYIKTGQFLISDNYFTFNGTNAKWHSYAARRCSLGGEHTFKDTGGTSYTGRLVTDYTDTTIYYVGHT